ncbi:MAG: T9SS type A sorting domain-containing protein [Candidatus Krumholzibacteriota bacterium]|nr:T9SS type A sorting domain-containing protein [Candidatus Krumholzibacteriota bacterium]
MKSAAFVSVVFLCVNLTLQAEAQSVPDPHDTLFVTASIPYEGRYGSGNAYVYLSDPLGTITNPVIAVEGFDLDNSMGWDYLYNHLNNHDLLETLRADGYDLIILDFTDATDYIQLNSYVLVELIQQVQAVIDPEQTIVVAGASMGGLCGRYALAYMERHSLEHRVRTFISFDAPNRGANIPLGIQYWLDFFSGLSTSAADLLASLDRPAARQMLVYHHTPEPGSTGEPDPLRAEMLADFIAVGEYPQNTRNVAIANGSGYGTEQGFLPGDQIIDYEYSDLLTTIRGNVWAVPEGTSQMIFEGFVRLVFIPITMNVTVSGTGPYDSAPGGWRSSMAEMDSTEAPYGDIIALYDNHSFIPTISALDIDTGDLNYDIVGDPDLLSHTPFDAVYYPAGNQEHASITAENAQWFIDEVDYITTGDPWESLPAAGVVMYQNYPNPFNPVTTIGFYLPRQMRLKLSVYNVKGELISTILDREMNEGYREVVWNGTNNNRTPVASGVYFYQLVSGRYSQTRKMILMR